MNIIKPLMAIEEQNEGGQSSFPSSPAPRQGQANISPVPLALSPGTGPGPAEPLHCRSWGQHSGAECGAVTSRHRFGVIWLVLIQLQKFGKHFVNNPRPGSDAFPERVFRAGDISSPDAVLFNAGISGRFAAESNPPRFAAEGEEGEAEALGGF